MASNDQKGNSQIEPFKVYIRIRPFLPKEISNESKRKSNALLKSDQIEKPKSIFATEENILFVIDPTINNRNEREYLFDGIFDEEYDNKRVFEQGIKPIIDNVLNGYNSTALAYGITGTGKTHTIFGDLTKQNSDTGIILYSSDYLFEKINNCGNKVINVKVSYLEIYNETVIDLLNPEGSPLMIMEDTIRGVVVPDLKEFEVHNSEQLSKLIIKGNAKRTMAPTNQNIFSSRSHAILQIMVEQREKVKDIKEEIVFSKFLVVDLAGSERGGLEKGIRREEGANINKSLLSLGTCINILSDKSKVGAFIPYRDSKLTRLLKDSLGGNILTVMIACVSPSPFTYDESINTLNYATRARKIQKKVGRNVKEVAAHISQYKDVIDSLKAEIFQLKDIIKNQQEQLNRRNTKNIVEEEKEYLDNNSDISSIHLNGKEDFFDTSEYIINNDNENNNNNNDNDNNNNNNNNDNDNDNNNDNNNNKDGFISQFGNANEKYDNFSLGNQQFSKTVKNVDVDIYRKLIENTRREDINENIIKLQRQIESIRNDKILLETYLENQPIKDEEISSKFYTLKIYYDEYIGLINDKLIENIEQGMILKCNLKEINELNITNNANLEILQKKIDTISTLDSEQNSCSRLVEEVTNIKKAIRENEELKQKIKESFSRNLKIKKILKKILLSLLTTSKETGMKYITVLKEKEQLQNKANSYEKKLQSFIVQQNKKDEQLQKVQKEVEELKRKLVEKDKTISRLKQNKSNVDFFFNTTNMTNYIAYKSNFKRKKSVPILNVSKTPNKNKSDNIQKFDKKARNRSKSSNRKSSPFNDNKNNNNNKINNNNINKNLPNKKNIQNIKKQKDFNIILKDYSTKMQNKKKSKCTNSNISQQTIRNSNIEISMSMKNNNKEFDLMSELNKLSRRKIQINYSKFINVKNSDKQVNSLQLARIENKMKSQRNITPTKMDKAESFIIEYNKTKQNDTWSINNKQRVDSRINSLINNKSDWDEDNGNIQTKKDESEEIINNYEEEYSERNHLINSNMNMVTETFICPSPEEFFKSLAESIKDPRLSKYLDTNKSNKK